MPWPAKQRAAIAADLARKGKSRAEISRFFHAHGHGGKKKPHPQTAALVSELRRRA